MSSSPKTHGNGSKAASRSRSPRRENGPTSENNGPKVIYSPPLPVPTDPNHPDLVVSRNIASNTVNQKQLQTFNDFFGSTITAGSEWTGHFIFIGDDADAIEGYAHKLAAELCQVRRLQIKGNPNLLNDSVIPCKIVADSYHGSYDISSALASTTQTLVMKKTKTNSKKESDSLEILEPVVTCSVVLIGPGKGCLDRKTGKVKDSNHPFATRHNDAARGDLVWQKLTSDVILNANPIKSMRKSESDSKSDPQISNEKVSIVIVQAKGQQEKSYPVQKEDIWYINARKVVFEAGLKNTDSMGKVVNLLSSKSQSAQNLKTVQYLFSKYHPYNDYVSNPTVSLHLRKLDIVASSVQTAQALVDLPPSHLTAHTYELFVRQQLTPYEDSGVVTIEVIRGHDLHKSNLNGIWNVGKGASFTENREPRLIILKYVKNQKNNTQKKDTNSNIIFLHTLVGKGIIFDTGGLAVKPVAGMCGMKRDMGGSAGVFGAFLAHVRINEDLKKEEKENDKTDSDENQNLCCLLCIAENSISSTSFRQDDVLHLYSGKTVEINNTDAEGRLVLADGVAFATADPDDKIRPGIGTTELVLDMCTLTGAQMIATGINHAALVCDNEEWENRVVQAGYQSGDLVWPLPYCPELYMPEFKSTIADFKNSVANRGNAQASCAASFIRENFVENFEKKKSPAWVHIDMAAPAFRGDRATGFGVALITKLLKQW